MVLGLEHLPQNKDCAAALATTEELVVKLVLPVLVALDYAITLMMGCFHPEGVRSTPPGYEEPTVLAKETACMYVSPPISSLPTHQSCSKILFFCKKPQFSAF
jgi:hypothetical protein